MAWRRTGIAGFEIPVRALFDEDANLAALRGILAAHAQE
jgi:hypothetical protein